MVPRDLAELRKMYLGFTASRVILTANNIGVFDRLDKPMTAGEAAGRLKIDQRAAGILLDALTGLGLVLKNSDGRYRNAAVSSRYLAKGARLYQGNIIRHASTMWQNFSALDEVVRTGRPARRGFDHASFIMGMHDLTLLRSEGLIRAVGLRNVGSMLDLGGGPGTNAIAMARKGVKAAIFDLPETIRIAKDVARREGVKGIRFLSGDFHVDPIGSGYDLILVSQIFHAYSEKENVALLHKCREALNPGGRVAVQEFPIDDTGTVPLQSALFSVNMLVGTAEGRCYSPGKIKGWLAESGFKGITVKNLDETVLILGRLKK